MNMALVMDLKGWGIRQAIREVGGNERLREACLIQEGEEVYPRSVVSSFIRKLEKVIQAIFKGKVVQLLKRIKARRLRAVLDAFFQRPGAGGTQKTAGRLLGQGRQGWQGPGGKRLGYKAHLVTIPRHEIIIALVTAQPTRTRRGMLKAYWRELRGVNVGWKGLKRVIADSQFSFEAFRKFLAGRGVEDIMPYPSNQRKGEGGLLRVDEKFRTAAEHVGAGLKLHTSFNRLGARGLMKVETRNLVSALCLNLVWEAAHNMGISEKARSITYFNT